MAVRDNVCTTVPRVEFHTVVFEVCTKLATRRLEVATVSKTLLTHKIVRESAFDDVDPVHLANGVARLVRIKQASYDDENLAHLGIGDELRGDVVELRRMSEACSPSTDSSAPRALSNPTVLRKVDDKRARHQLTLVRQCQRICDGVRLSSEPSTLAKSHGFITRADQANEVNAVRERQQRAKERVLG